ncbi:hypothetical protein HDU96_003229 [Phlyctochytrium bullatum]|nr:hypothetical protein HDU96_003229 [Phlyctochytrium bullatum]
MKARAEKDREETERRMGRIWALQDALNNNVDYYVFRERLWLEMREISQLTRVRLPSESQVEGPIDNWSFKPRRLEWIKRFEVDEQLADVAAWYASNLVNDEKSIRQIEMERLWWEQELDRIQKSLGE